MSILDIFNDDAFSMTSMTAAINKQPFVPGQIGALGLFEAEGVNTTTVAIEMLDGRLSLVAASERGGPGQTVTRERANMRVFPTYHFQRDDAVMADEIQGVRMFGSESQLETIENVRDRKVARHTRDMDLTVEQLHVGAIKGQLAPVGGRAINLFTEFGVAALPDTNWDLDADATKLRVLASDAISEMEDELDAGAYSGVAMVCGRTLYKKFIEHKSVRETYLNTVQAAELRGGIPDSFQFANMDVVRYKTGAKASAANGGVGFIADNEARLVFRGVPGLFITRYAPADYMDTANTIGLPRYASEMRVRKDNKGADFEVQMNPIMLCTQPRTLKRLVCAA